MKLNKFLSVAYFVSLLLFQFSCQKDYSFERGAMSTGSIIMNATTNSCIAAANGSYNVGNALNSNNFILDSINVTSAGSYSVITDTVNGIWFKAIGKVNNTGHFAVKLQGYGTPLAKGTFNYTLTYDSTSCVVSVFVDTAKSNGSGGTGGNGSNSNNYIHCTIDGKAFTFDNTVSDTLFRATQNGIALSTLLLQGQTDANDTADIQIVMAYIGNITTGTYSSSSITTGSLGCVINYSPTNIYQSSSTWQGGGSKVGSSGLCSITISSITSTQVTGTFSCTLLNADGSGSTSTITNGTFSGILH